MKFRSHPSHLFNRNFRLVFKVLLFLVLCRTQSLAMLFSFSLPPGWFVYQLIRLLGKQGTLDSDSFGRRDSTSHRKVLDELCLKGYEMASATLPKTWVQHECNTPGCKEGLAVLDGLMKVIYQTYTICTLFSKMNMDQLKIFRKLTLI